MNDNFTTQEAAINEIRSIILREDRSKLEQLRNDLDNKEEFSKRVSPIIEERINFFKKEFPTEFKSVIDELIDQRIKNSQEQILNIIYPVMGKMIKKYIQHQFELLRESINQQFKKVTIFSIKKKAYKKEVTFADQMLSELDLSVIHEIYVIQKESGILLGSLAGGEIVDADALAGMLTAIKLFVEDAFKQKTQNLETIRYENYQIFVYNCYSYYIAVAIEGSLSRKKTHRLEDAILEVSPELTSIINTIDQDTSAKVKKILQHHFYTIKEKSNK